MFIKESNNPIISCDEAVEKCYFLRTNGTSK